MNALLKPRRAPVDLRDAYLRSSSDDSPEALDALLERQSDLVAAHLLKIGRAVVAKDMQTFPALARSIAAAEPWLRGATDRERQHVAAARAWLAHRPLHAAHMYSIVSASDPHDLLALRLAQSCWYFLGRRAKVHSVAERALRSWSAEEPGYDIAVAMLAFGCDEIGDAERAHALAVRSLELEPRSPYAIHALAHAMASREPAAAVVRFLMERAAHWRVGGRLDSHVAWHVAVAQLEQCDADAALAVLERELLPLADEGPSAASDATDLAWRLELAGADVAGVWGRLASAWTRHPPGFWPPYDMLAGIAYLRAELPEQVLALRRTLKDGPHVRPCIARASAVMTLPAIAAIEAFVHGAFATAESQLRATIRGMEGSLLQRELFELTLRAACRLRSPSATPPAASRIPA